MNHSKTACHTVDCNKHPLLWLERRLRHGLAILQWQVQRVDLLLLGFCVICHNTREAAFGDRMWKPFGHLYVT